MADSPDHKTSMHDRLHALLLSTPDLQAALAELAQLATTVVTAAPTACGITLRYDANLMTVGSSDTRASTLDETQYATGEGPCLQTLHTGRTVEIIDTRTEARWSDYLPHLLHAGVRCSLSLPLSLGEDTFGALNVYGFDQPNLFGAVEHHQLELFAAQAAGTLRVVRRLSNDTRLLDQMERALGSRTVIDQALGIIMGQQHCTATIAFDLLRRQSQTSHRRLADVATDLVERTTGQPTQAGHRFDPS